MKRSGLILTIAALVLALTGCSSVVSATNSSPSGTGKVTDPSAVKTSSAAPRPVDYGPMCQRWVDFNSSEGTTQDQVPAVYAPLVKAVHPACVIRTGEAYQLLFDQNMASVLGKLVAVGWENRNGSSALLMVGQCQLSIVELVDAPNLTGKWSAVFVSEDATKFSLFLLGAPVGC